MFQPAKPEESAKKECVVMEAEKKAKSNAEQRCGTPEATCKPNPEKPAQAKPRAEKQERKVKPWSEKQELALQLILNGVKIKDTAEKVGVDRRTINRWMKHPRFEAGLQRGEQVLRDTLHGQMVAMVNTAFDALQKAMDKEDYQVAVGLLKSIRALDGRPAPASEQQAPADETTRSTAEVTTENSANAASVSENGEASRGHLGHFRADRSEGQGDHAEQGSLESTGHLGHSADISLVQQQVLQGLEEGKSLAQAIEERKVSVVTLQHWLKFDSEFQAAVNAYSEWTQGYWELRSVQLGLYAAACVNRALQNGNGRVALQVLRGLGAV